MHIHILQQFTRDRAARRMHSPSMNLLCIVNLRIQNSFPMWDFNNAIKYTECHIGLILWDEHGIEVRRHKS